MPMPTNSPEGEDAHLVVVDGGGENEERNGKFWHQNEIRSNNPSKFKYSLKIFSA
jgi:hypothetical protein